MREGLAKHLFDSIDGTVDFCILVEHEFYNKSESLFVNELKNICEQFNARSCIFTFDSNKNYQFTDFFNNNIDGSVQLKAVSPLNASQFPDRLFDLKWRDSSKRFVFRLETSGAAWLDSELLSANVRQKLGVLHVQLRYVSNELTLFATINAIIKAKFSQDALRYLRECSTDELTASFVDDFRSRQWSPKSNSALRHLPPTGSYTKQSFSIDSGFNLQRENRGKIERIEISNVNSLQLDSGILFDIRYKEDSFLGALKSALCSKQAFVFQRYLGRNYSLATDFVRSHLIADFYGKQFNSKASGKYSIRVNNIFLATPVQHGKSAVARSNPQICVVTETNSETAFSFENTLRFDQTKEILDAFAHFSYEVSEDRFMVHSFNTVSDKVNSITLLEPVVFSTSLVNCSLANLGAPGIERFIQTHDCNHICKIVSNSSFIKDKHVNK